MQKECTHFDRESRSGFIVSSGFTEKEGERLISKLTERFSYPFMIGSFSSASPFIKEVSFTKHYAWVELIHKRKKLCILGC